MEDDNEREEGANQTRLVSEFTPLTIATILGFEKTVMGVYRVPSNLDK